MRNGNPGVETPGYSQMSLRDGVRVNDAATYPPRQLEFPYE